MCYLRTWSVESVIDDGSLTGKNILLTVLSYIYASPGSTLPRRQVRYLIVVIAWIL